MTNSIERVPVWYWLLAGLAALWEAIGVASYLGQVYGAMEMSPAQQQLVGSTPAWVTGAYAIAVFSGLAGALALLLRRRWAKPLLVVSLVAAVVQYGYIFGIGGALDLVGGSAIVLPLLILLIGAGLIWFASYADRRGWLA
ncbi:MAG TPA: hypothetical protein VF628_09155 [Allosphingosinicella sp.]|jgi:hypothetical protein